MKKTQLNYFIFFILTLLFAGTAFADKPVKVNIINRCENRVHMYIPFKGQVGEWVNKGSSKIIEVKHFTDWKHTVEEDGNWWFWDRAVTFYPNKGDTTITCALDADYRKPGDNSPVETFSSKIVHCYCRK